jgi:hypothetical protein
VADVRSLYRSLSTVRSVSWIAAICARKSWNARHAGHWYSTSDGSAQSWRRRSDDRARAVMRRTSLAIVRSPNRNLRIRMSSPGQTWRTERSFWPCPTLPEKEIWGSSEWAPRAIEVGRRPGGNAGHPDERLAST